MSWKGIEGKASIIRRRKHRYQVCEEGEVWGNGMLKDLMKESTVYMLR